MTVQVLAIRLLEYLGITRLTAQSSGSKLDSLQSQDAVTIAGIITAAMQELFERGPAEMRQKPGNGVLRPPASVTLTATQYSSVVSVVTTYASWMAGCTIRISGEDQDNELLTSTVLARPYMGTTGSGITATVYADALTLDNTVGHVLPPVEIPNRTPLYACPSRKEYLMLMGEAGVVDERGIAYVNSFSRRSVGEPLGYFVEGYYDSTLDYLPRRIRFAPLPDTAYSVGYRASINPTKYTATDIGSDGADPGTKFPIPNSYIESILLPMCLQRLTGHPRFTNEAVKPEIARQYKAALALLDESKGQRGTQKASYV